MSRVLEVLGSIAGMARWYASTSSCSAEDLEGIGRLKVIEREADYDATSGTWRTFACRVARTAMRHAVRAAGRRQLETFDAMSTSETIALLTQGAVGEWYARASQEDAAYVDEVMRQLEAPRRGVRRFAAEVVHGARPAVRPAKRGVRTDVAVARRAAAVIVLRQ